MITSQSVKEIIPALIEVQKELKPVVKSGQNPHFHSAYAKFEDVIEAAKPVLNKHGFWLTQTTQINEGGLVIIETILFHKSGEWVLSQLPVINKAGTDQGLGSSLSYTKRYSLLAILGFATPDDDGEAASKEAPKNEPKVKNAPKAQGVPPPNFPEDEPFPGFEEATGIADNVTPEFQDFYAALNKYGELEVLSELSRKNPNGKDFYASVAEGFKKYKRLTPGQKNALKKDWTKFFEEQH